jgi:CRISPR-associated protein Cas1
MLSAPDFKQKQIIFAQLSRGDKLSFKNDNIIIKDSDGNIKHQSTCYRLFALFIVGHTTITSGLLQRAKRFGFSIHLLSHNLRHYGSWQSKVEGNTLLRQRQYSYHKLDIAQHLIANKIEQQIATLNKRRKKSDELKTAIKQLKDYRSRLPNGNHQLQDILGIEGIASRVYFSHLFADHNWQGRKPRVKHDITNVLLDSGYTLLFNLIDDLLQLYGFDTYQGVYHQLFYQRKSLTCDLVEPFRPIIDHRILVAWNLGQIKEQDFHLNRHQYLLHWNNSKPYVKFLLTALLEEKDQIFIYIQRYYRAFMRDKHIEQYPTYPLC